MHANPVIAGGIQGSPGNRHVAASHDRGRADSQSRGGTPDVDINPEAGGVARKHRYNYAIHRIGVGLSDRPHCAAINRVTVVVTIYNVCWLGEGRVNTVN